MDVINYGASDIITLGLDVKKLSILVFIKILFMKKFTNVLKIIIFRILT